jgi:hypothetical protein
VRPAQTTPNPDKFVRNRTSRPKPDKSPKAPADRMRTMSDLDHLRRLSWNGFVRV